MGFLRGYGLIVLLTANIGLALYIFFPHPAVAVIGIWFMTSAIVTPILGLLLELRSKSYPRPD
jgi:hypothetical protein